MFMINKLNQNFWICLHFCLACKTFIPSFGLHLLFEYCLLVRLEFLPSPAGTFQNIHLLSLKGRFSNVRPGWHNVATHMGKCRDPLLVLLLLIEAIYCFVHVFS
jgi:hypothetical protein